MKAGTSGGMSSSVRETATSVLMSFTICTLTDSMSVPCKDQQPCQQLSIRDEEGSLICLHLVERLGALAHLHGDMAGCIICEVEDVLLQCQPAQMGSAAQALPSSASAAVRASISWLQSASLAMPNISVFRYFFSRASATPAQPCRPQCHVERLSNPCLRNAAHVPHRSPARMSGEQCRCLQAPACSPSCLCQDAVRSCSQLVPS